MLSTRVDSGASPVARTDCLSTRAVAQALANAAISSNVFLVRIKAPLLRSCPPDDGSRGPTPYDPEGDGPTALVEGDERTLERHP